MIKIVLIMERQAIAQRLSQMLNESPDMSLVCSDYSCAERLVANHHAHIALIEVSENDVYDLAYCLRMAKEIKSDSAVCKVLLMCSEQNSETVEGVVQAKNQGKIDDFLFYDCTFPYMLSKLSVS